MIPLQPWRRMIGLDEVVEQFETVAPRRGREHRALGDARVLVDCILYAEQMRKVPFLGKLRWEVQSRADGKSTEGRALRALDEIEIAVIREAYAC